MRTNVNTTTAAIILVVTLALVGCGGKQDDDGLAQARLIGVEVTDLGEQNDDGGNDYVLLYVEPIPGVDDVYLAVIGWSGGPRGAGSDCFHIRPDDWQGSYRVSKGGNAPGRAHIECPLGA